MMEKISKIISKGIDTYSKNLNLCIPFILNMVINGLLIFIVIIFSMVSIFSSFSFNEYKTPEDLSIAVLSILAQHVYEIAALLLITILIILVISAFFTSGAIGMAKQATETGRSGLSTMMEAGKRNFMNLFLADILVLLVALAGIVFIVPGIKNFDFNQPSDSAGLLLIGGFLLWMVYLMILGVALAAFRYALVIESLGPVEGILAGINFFKKNLFDVIVLLVVTIFAGIVFAIIDQIMNRVPVINIIWIFISLIISICILNPLMTIWWVRLYLTRTNNQVYENDLLAHPNDLEKNR